MELKTNVPKLAQQQISKEVDVSDRTFKNIEMIYVGITQITEKGSKKIPTKYF